MGDDAFPRFRPRFVRFLSCGRGRGLAIHRRLNLAIVLGAAVALLSAAVVSAAPMQPALSSVPFVQISDAAAQAARQSPICPNGLVCYSPSFIRQAYDFPSGPGAPTGAGQTILIVEAYGSPTIKD